MGDNEHSNKRKKYRLPNLSAINKLYKHKNLNMHNE